MKKCSLLLLLIQTWYTPSLFAQCSLPKPSNVKVNTITSCDATLTWNPVASAAYYQVRYRFRNTKGYTVIATHLNTTSYTFTNLVADSAYKFGVQAYCSNGNGSDWKNVQKTTPLITTPDSLHATNIAGTTVSLAWSEHCPGPSFNIRYRITGGRGWTVIKSIPIPSYTAVNLTRFTPYDFEVQAKKSGDTSKWTKVLNVNSGDTGIGSQPHGPPNIILFVMDDARYDPFIPNGGPAWFNTPSINRIANEGINFVYSFPTTSQCAPSRVSIYSGLYASHHGAVDNNSRHFDGIPLVQQILHDAGYYTGFVGKYGQLQGDPQGFDWWATSDGNVYLDPPYKINGRDTAISGHITDVYQGLALTFLNKVPAGKKFCLMFFTRVPHAPTTPRTQDASLFTSEIMPFPPNFYRYSANYPSYLYNSGHTWTHDDVETDSAKLADFQCLYGAEVNMSAIFNWLTIKGILDSSIIIFTSDNGYMEGEHKLEAKQLALEESIRVPMFIRYPAWFSPGEVNTSIMAFNVDIAPTLLDAAGIPNTFGMDGSSLLQIYNGNIHRKYFYYQCAGDGTMPPLRGVRSSQFIYIKTFCSQLTEEFYDLTNDPEENTNQINSNLYTSIIANYRLVLDSIKNALGDSDPVPADCNLSNPQFSREADEEADEWNLKNIEVYPNPASRYFMIHFTDETREDIEVSITDLLSKKMYCKKMPETNAFNTLIDAQGWQPGLYLVKVKKGDRSFTRKFTLQ